MPHRLQGVVARAKGEPVTVETITVPDPQPGEAPVEVRACGVCHTDLQYRQGGISDDFPFFLGHEAAGVAEQVSDGVSGLEPGDHVVIAWRAVQPVPVVQRGGGAGGADRRTHRPSRRSAIGR